MLKSSRRHSDYIKHKGILLVMSSPSGAGKTTLTHLLLEQEKYVTLSISTTTRKPRPGEEEGVHYYFKTKVEFDALVESDAFFEHAKVFGNYYGTPKAPVENALLQGYDVLLDVDWQGAQQLIQEYQSRVVSIFILPPSLEELENRLTKRAQDAPNVIASRMDKAMAEISHWAEYDYVVVNDNLDKSLNDIRSIIRSERLKRWRQMGLSDFIHNLHDEEED